MLFQHGIIIHKFSETWLPVTQFIVSCSFASARFMRQSSVFLFALSLLFQAEDSRKTSSHNIHAK